MTLDPTFVAWHYRQQLDVCLCFWKGEGRDGPDGWPDHWIVSIAAELDGEWRVLQSMPDFYLPVLGVSAAGPFREADDLIRLTGQSTPEFITEHL